MGMSAAAMILCGGAAGKRFSLPNALDIDRDHSLTAEDARDDGLIDDIIAPRRGVAGPRLEAAVA